MSPHSSICLVVWCRSRSSLEQAVAGFVPLMLFLSIRLIPMRRHCLVPPVILIFIIFAGFTLVVPPASPQTGAPAQARPSLSSQLQLHLAAGIEAMREGDNSSAADQFRRALAVDPGSLSALNNLGIVLSRLGKAGEAIRLYKKALVIRPGDPATARNLAIAYFKTQREMGSAVFENRNRQRSGVRDVPGKNPRSVGSRGWRLDHRGISTVRLIQCDR